MAREEMLAFTRNLFRGRPDLSTLTHSIVRRRFLAHAGRDHLEPQEKQALKRLVEEELLNMQGDEANGREEKRDLARKAKRPPTPCSDPERKRSRFSSESEPSSGASSPDCVDPPAKDRMATEIRATEERPRRASKKPLESSDEEQPEDSTAKTGSEEGMKESSEEEEEEGSVRTGKVLKAEGSEGEEGEEGKREPKGRTRKQPGMNNKRVLGRTSAKKTQAKEVSEDSETGSEEDMRESSGEEEGSVRTRKGSEAEGSEGKGEEGDREPKGRTRKPPGMSKTNSARRKQAKEGSEDSGEEEPIQRTGQKTRRKMGTKSHHESEDDDDEGENLVAEEENQEEEDWKSRPQSKGRKGTACEQKSRGAGLPGSEDNREAQQDSGDEADSSGENSSKKATSTTDTGKPAKVGRLNGDESDSEREESDSEAEGSPKGERKNRSSKKNSKKGRTRNSSSSSSDGSPETKFRKAGSGRRGEDDPAVMRLKRYIRACGAYRNYKKLLGSCHSSKERLRILRAELEALGMKGNPSLEKCRALKEQREEAAEVASLDVNNIINCPGRPRRRTAWNPSAAAPPGQLYRRTLDSEDEQPRPPPPDWSHMRGIISSDGESN